MTADLVVSASNPLVTLTSKGAFRLDSGYDEIESRFRVSVPAETTQLVLTVSGKTKTTPPAGGDPLEDDTWWFDVDVNVRRNAWAVGLLGAFVGTLLAVAPIVNAFSNDKLTSDQRNGIAVLALVTSWVAGAVAALSFKKPI